MRAACFRLTRSLSLALALAAAGSAQAQSFSTLEERMSEREFTSAGLNKLSAEELAYLNAWLAQKASVGVSSGTQQSTPAGQSPADRVGLPPERVEGSDQVTSRLLGSFRGWTGNTEFRLENGQVWQQTGGGNLSGVSLESPEVFIEKSMFGAWYLRVEGYNTRAKVKRLR
ncbi:hypothetical protein [Aquimonas sp.]|jgi:hypothetical protein|uniref:hypothetical protein n=1 Tax=Aquimonas sp. TaxID=1872588 RepID=UPI0037BF7487